jgi:hypothetical protein
VVAQQPRVTEVLTETMPDLCMNLAGPKVSSGVIELEQV